MGEYFGDLLDERADGDGDDLVTLAATSDDLERGEKIGFCILLLIAGNITTTNLVTNTIWCFDEHGVTDAVRTGEIDRKQAIEEVLRYRSPVQSFVVSPRRDVEIGGKTIEAVNSSPRGSGPRTATPTCSIPRRIPARSASEPTHRVR